MKVGVVGTGYVGLVVGACLSETGHDVVCVDVDESKIARLRQGDVPIYEPGLEELVRRNLADGRLRFTTSVPEAVRASDILFIAVGTPPDEDGSADLSQVLSVARTIGDHANGEKVVITKSTVPVGTAARVRAVIHARTGHRVHVCSNPEFLKEGAAVDDFMKPDRVVVGVDSDFARGTLEELYAPFVRTGKPILFMDLASAEITKYAANVMLAARISFINSIASLCADVGADVEQVRRGVGTDSRIGPSFLFAGCGYGGSCFPKDVRALIRTMREHEVDPCLLEAVETVNAQQKTLLVRAALDRFGGELRGRTFGVWGLAFKPETDDMREAPSLTAVRALLARGATVQVHDPRAMSVARRYFGGQVAYCETPYEAAEDADALFILTEWKPYRRPDLERVRGAMLSPVIFDGRNLFDPTRMRQLGFEYTSVGRTRGVPLRLVPEREAVACELTADGTWDTAATPRRPAPRLPEDPRGSPAARGAPRLSPPSPAVRRPGRAPGGDAIPFPRAEPRPAAPPDGVA